MRPGELTLDQMLADPIVHLLMQRDGVEEAHVRRLMALVAEQRAARALHRLPASAPVANDGDAPRSAFLRIA